MTSSSLFLLLLLLPFFVPLRQVTGAKVVFDYYVLALTWPNTFCTVEQSSPIPCGKTGKKDLTQVFTIHGLWPSLFVGVLKPYCTQVAFQFRDMPDALKTAATKRWPDIKKCVLGKTKAKDNEVFWSTEWRKHGTCSNLSQDNYMQLAMDLYDKVSTEIVSAMRSHPPGGTVSIVDFTSTLAKLVKKKPRLVCQTIPTGQQLLSEIQFNVDKSSEEFIDAGNSNCNSSIPVQFP